MFCICPNYPPIKTLNTAIAWWEDQQLHKTRTRKPKYTSSKTGEVRENIVFNIDIYEVQEMKNPQRTQTENEK